MHRIDSPGATVDDKFTDGDPVGGVQSTVVDADWLNAVQEEIVSVLADQSITPVKGTHNQLLLAIKALFTGKAATQPQTDAGVDDTTYVTPKKLRAGFAALFSSSGYIAFPSWLGGWMVQWGSATTSASDNVTATFPIPFTVGCFRVAPTHGTSGTPVATGVAPATLTTVNLRIASSGTNTISYIAIGK